MRTTIEISDQQRARLLELAAGRGMKGFSTIVGEAIGLYLEHEASRREQIAAALRLAGALSDEEADALESAARATRSHWR